MHNEGQRPFFGAYVESDMVDSDNQILYFGQGGLGIGNRDYYDKDKLFEELKGRYKETAENSAVSAWERYNASCRMSVYADGDESVETVLSK